MLTSVPTKIPIPARFLTGILTPARALTRILMYANLGPEGILRLNFERIPVTEGALILGGTPMLEGIETSARIQTY